MKAPKLTASDIRIAMAKRWAEPEYAVMWEVGEGTGAASGRYADAIIMSLWPSRGLELHGVEIKVSRSDYKREAADPSKAEAIAKYCDRWWVHTPPGIVDDLSALPPAWGLREFDGKAWKTVREAGLTSAAPVTRTFLAAILRRADGTMRAMVQEAARAGREEIDRERETMREQFRKSVEDSVARKTKSLEDAKRNVDAFQAAFGVDAAVNWAIDFPSLGAAARALADCRKTNGYVDLSVRLRNAADEIAAISAMSAPQWGGAMEQERTE